MKTNLIKGCALISSIILLLLNHLSIWHLLIVLFFLFLTRQVEVSFNRSYVGWLIIFILIDCLSFVINPQFDYKRELILSILRMTLYCSSFMVFISIPRELWTYPKDSSIKNVEKNKFLMLLFFLIILLYLPLMIAFSPGNMYIDSYSQWGQAMGGIPLSDWHPIFTTLLLKISYQLIETPILYTALQIIFSILVLLYYSRILLDLNMKKRFVLLILAIVIFSTTLLSNMVTLYKDNLYNLSLILLCLFLVRYYFIDSNWLKRPINIFLFSLNFNILLLGRHNGLYVGLAFLLIWFVLSLDQWKTITTTIISVLIILTIYKGPILDQFVVIPSSPSEKYSMILQHIGAVVDEEKPLTDEEELFLNQIIPLKIWREKYTPVMIDPVKFHSEFKKEFINSHQNELLRIWMGLFKRYPTTFLLAELKQIRPLWDINGWEHGLPGTQMFHYMIHSPKKYYDPYLQKYDFDVESLRTLISNISYAQSPHDGKTKPFITSFAAVSIIMLYGMFLGALFKFEKIKLLVLLPLMLHIGTLILAMPAYNIRYILGVILSSVLLSFIFLVEKQNSATSEK